MPFSSSDLRLTCRSTLVFVVIGLIKSFTAAERTFNIVNACPQPITVYMNGESQGTVATGDTVAKTVGDDWSGFIYSNVNAPEGNTGVGTTKAGFVNQAAYYFIAKDSSNFNAGISVVPSSPSSGGLCRRVTCNSRFCANSFVGQPSEFPAPSTQPPAPPLFSCSSSQSFRINFCPGGAFPRAGGAVDLHPKGDTRKCLEVRGGLSANGTAVQIADCNANRPPLWRLTPGTTQVRLGDTGFCLDAGSVPRNRAQMKVWKCIDGLPAQTWTYNARSQLVLGSSGLCLDVTLGSTANGNVIQTFQCSNGNENQIFTIT